MSVKENKIMTSNSDDTKYIFRFPTREVRQQLKIIATTRNMSMRELLCQIVLDFLEKNKETALT